MADFKELITVIESAVEAFNKSIPGIQKKMLDDILLLTKQLDVKDGKIKIATANLKIIAQAKAKLQALLLNPDYIKSVKEYIQNFDEITRLQNQYFSHVESTFKPPKLAKEIKKQAVEGVVNSLTENGLNANIVDKVAEMLRLSTTSGASYNTLNKQLTDFLTNNQSGDGQLLKYTRQITVDSLNQFSGQYSQIITSDLNFEWFRYTGSNIETSRPFCLACTKRKFFHISELPKVIKGDFAEFKDLDGSINKKTELPEGMYSGTDVSNFMTYRGGYNCGHQWQPLSEELVPEEYRKRVYESTDYHIWAVAHGKPLKATSSTLPAPLDNSGPTKIVDNNKGSINSLKDRGVKFYDEVLKLMPEDVKIVDEKDSGSSYNPSTKTMIIGGRDRASNEYYQNKIVLHEGGHAIHFEKEIITFEKVSPEFKGFYDNLKSVIKGKEAELDDLLWNLINKNYKDTTKTEQLGILHDTLGGITKGDYGAGHNLSYYKTNNKSEMEVFAHSITLAKLENEFSDIHPSMRELVDLMKAYGLNILQGI